MLFLIERCRKGLSNNSIERVSNIETYLGCVLVSSVQFLVFYYWSWCSPLANFHPPNIYLRTLLGRGNAQNHVVRLLSLGTEPKRTFSRENLVVSYASDGRALRLLQRGRRAAVR